MIDKNTQLLILDAYGQAIFGAKEKGMTGAVAKKAALAATARVVSKATGQQITAEIVERLVGQ